ncbi:glycosyltransferase [Aminiphilus circumscriptus]|uniref:glycosyltransferase n=1 Tax=Aminiphilus circumscriptus TaxID=290732 RepID=UPI000492842B|nr:glycosyltransferase [Aminiphilus circumscriptus]
MNVALLLPEFEEGGVERHVLWLAQGLSGRGLGVTVISRGGKLVGELPEKVPHVGLPVHAKNPVTAVTAALRIARMARRGECHLLHAHSRVPAFVAWWASAFSGIPWIMTCHARYSKNAGLLPLRRADGAICVSETVRNHLQEFLPERTTVIPGGIPLSRGEGPFSGEVDAEGPNPGRRGDVPRRCRLLFVGRLTRVKGIAFLLDLLARDDLSGRAWSLDIVGDGPLRNELFRLVSEKGMANRVTFHGFREDVESFLVRCDCLLFPSLDEGMGLVLAQALAAGIPVLASDLPAVRELVADVDFLVPAGDADAWSSRLRTGLDGGVFPVLAARRTFSLDEMCDRTVTFYDTVLSPGAKKGIRTE